MLLLLGIIVQKDKTAFTFNRSMILKDLIFKTYKIR